MTDTQTCSRCSHELNRPIKATANYVIASDFAEPEDREVHYALVHTEETISRLETLEEKFPNRDVQGLAAEAAHHDADEVRESVIETTTVENDDGTTVETAKKEEVEFSIPVEKFEHVEVESPKLVRSREDVAYVYTELEEREIQKTGVVCPDCTDSDDEIIWGPDSE